MNSKEYRKAYKHFLKTKTEPSNDVTPFRAQEQRFKSRFPPPDLNDVLDLWTVDPNLVTSLKFIPNVTMGSSGDDLGLCHLPMMREGDETSRRAYCLRSHPGLILLPGYLSHEEQRALVRTSLTQQAREPNETNLDTHYILPGEGLWNACHSSKLHPASHDRFIFPRSRPIAESGFRAEASMKRSLVENPPGEAAIESRLDLSPPTPSTSLAPQEPLQLLPKLRWANIGRSYHWGAKTYDFTKPVPQFPQDVRDICQRVVKMIPWKDVWSPEVMSTPVLDEEWGPEGPDWTSWPISFEPDAGIVNFYQLKDTLMGHVDRSEVSSTTPLVSISLGNAAIFLIGGSSRDVIPTPILLRSGDVIVMSGPRCRRAFHGVPLIIEDTLPPHLRQHFTPHEDDWEPFSTYMKTTRININVRQVFPRGYELSSQVNSTE